MKNVLNKKLVLTISLILIVDILCVGCWTLYIKPESSESIALIFLIPIVFMANFIIAAVIYFIKKYYTPFFIINAFISSVMMFLFFGWYIEIDKKINTESWEFFIDNTKYDISYWSQNRDSTYRITYSYEPGMSFGDSNGRGIVHIKKDTIYFYAVDSTQYYIYNNYLYNFKNTDKVKIKKIY
jgi:hypothetical protein